MRNNNSEPDSNEISNKLDAILAVLVLGLSPEQKEKERRIEQVLSGCGLSNECIGKILGKKSDAIRMMLSRARQK